MPTLLIRNADCVATFDHLDANQARELHSDLDLLVIEHQVTDKAAEYLRLHRAVGNLGVGVDVIVMFSEEFERLRPCLRSAFMRGKRWGKNCNTQ